MESSGSVRSDFIYLSCPKQSLGFGKSCCFCWNPSKIRVWCWHLVISRCPFPLSCPGKERELPRVPGISSDPSNTCSSRLGLPSPCPSQRIFPACTSPGVPGWVMGTVMTSSCWLLSVSWGPSQEGERGREMPPEVHWDAPGEAQAAGAPRWARLCPLQALPGRAVPAPCQGSLLGPGSALIQPFSLEGARPLLLPR